MEVFCTAVDEFEAETIIVDLMEAGFADNDITVRVPPKPGGIAISVHAEDSEGATLVKFILSNSGGQEIAMGNEGNEGVSHPRNPQETVANYRKGRWSFLKLSSATSSNQDWFL